jgi:hypothetical protein
MRASRLAAVLLALALAGTIVGGAASASATTAGGTRSAAAGEGSCWVDAGSGDSLCVAPGADLVAAVARERGIRLVVPDGTTIGGIRTSAARTAALGAQSLQATTVLSILYDGLDYGGGSYVMSVTGGSCATSAYGFTDLGAIGWDNHAASFRSYNGCRTAVFQNTNYGGAHVGYSTNVSNLGSLNDQGSSWRVTG